MPMYRHTCPNPECKHSEVDLFKYNDPAPVCPKCGTEMKREIGKPGFEVK